MMLQVTPHIAIPDSELHFDFVRASGPGGQNVNKVSTAVQLRFDVAASPSLPEAVRERLMRQAAGRITTEGVLIIDARACRSQERNRAEAVERLAELVRAASVAPKPRRKTKPTRASQRRRVDTKRRRGAVKTLRRGVDPAAE